MKIGEIVKFKNEGSWEVGDRFEVVQIIGTCVKVRNVANGRFGIWGAAEFETVNA